MAAKYYVDQDDVVWTCNPAKGEASRFEIVEYKSGVTATNVITLRISELTVTKGPLRALQPGRERLSRQDGQYEERRRWVRWLLRSSYGFNWWNDQGMHPPIRAEEYAIEVADEWAKDGGANLDAAEVGRIIANNTGWKSGGDEK